LPGQGIAGTGDCRDGVVAISVVFRAVGLWGVACSGRSMGFGALGAAYDVSDSRNRQAYFRENFHSVHLDIFIITILVKAATSRHKRSGISERDRG